jgi:hypothetical protein
MVEDDALRTSHWRKGFFLVTAGTSFLQIREAGF